LHAAEIQDIVLFQITVAVEYRYVNLGFDSSLFSQIWDMSRMVAVLIDATIMAITPTTIADM